MQTIDSRIATELSVNEKQVTAAISLLDEGATVPFIARYRKEKTNGLDDAQLRNVEERLTYLRALKERRETILQSIESQGKLTDALTAQINATQTKQSLEDLYLPYKPKRRTKAQIALEAGIVPLADHLMEDPTTVPEEMAEGFLNPEAGFDTIAKVLDGARDVLMERWSEQPELVGSLRERLWDKGLFAAQVIEGKQAEGEKFRDYFDYAEPISSVPSHRALAVFRGRNEGILTAKLILARDPEAAKAEQAKIETIIATHIGWQDQQRAADTWIKKGVAWTWQIKLLLSLERDAFVRLKDNAEHDAIEVFGANLRDLLLAAPAGQKPVIGLDPGIRTGVKVAVVDATGKLLDTATVYPHQPRKDWQGSLATLQKLILQHDVSLIAIGNGTASRETDQLAADVIKSIRADNPAFAAKLSKIVVSEAGASVYSASEYASQEMPEVDVSLRGAASIARRLQDPLAELVKIDPKSIGVGQYQHDVNQGALAKQLDSIVEDCVNAVGVDLNTASAPLLQRVSGLSQRVAQNIIEYRDTHGAFDARKKLLKVAGLGPKAFEQAAGFLRIQNGEQPLDASAVHPESYSVVERLLAKLGQPLSAVMGNPKAIKQLASNDSYFKQDFADVGEFTLRDILNELEKPGRDPRPDFVVAKLSEGVETMSDLKAGMTLEGTVTNVANFGAFVDVGVHQDGLVHISQLADKFIKDPREVVKAGDIVKVTVTEVDVARKRIGLSMRSNPEISGDDGKQAKPASKSNSKQAKTKQKPNSSSGQNTAMADAFAKLKR